MVTASDSAFVKSANIPGVVHNSQRPAGCCGRGAGGPPPGGRGVPASALTPKCLAGTGSWERGGRERRGEPGKCGHTRGDAVEHIRREVREREYRAAGRLIAACGDLVHVHHDRFISTVRIVEDGRDISHARCV
jgi:hypothetical protein